MANPSKRNANNNPAAESAQQALLQQNAAVIDRLNDYVRLRGGGAPGPAEAQLAQEAYRNMLHIALALPPEALTGPRKRLKTFVRTTRNLGLLQLPSCATEQLSAALLPPVVEAYPPATAPVHGTAAGGPYTGWGQDQLPQLMPPSIQAPSSGRHASLLQMSALPQTGHTGQPPPNVEPMPAPAALNVAPAQVIRVRMPSGSGAPVEGPAQVPLGPSAGGAAAGAEAAPRPASHNATVPSGWQQGIIHIGKGGASQDWGRWLAPGKPQLAVSTLSSKPSSSQQSDIAQALGSGSFNDAGPSSSMQQSSVEAASFSIQLLDLLPNNLGLTKLRRASDPLTLHERPASAVSQPEWLECIPTELQLRQSQDTLRAVAAVARPSLAANHPQLPLSQPAEPSQGPLVGIGAGANLRAGFSNPAQKQVSRALLEEALRKSSHLAAQNEAHELQIQLAMPILPQAALFSCSAAEVRPEPRPPQQLGRPPGSRSHGSRVVKGFVADAAAASHAEMARPGEPRVGLPTSVFAREDAPWQPVHGGSSGEDLGGARIGSVASLNTWAAGGKGDGLQSRSSLNSLSSVHSIQNQPSLASWGGASGWGKSLIRGSNERQSSPSPSSPPRFPHATSAAKADMLRRLEANFPLAVAPDLMALTVPDPHSDTGLDKCALP